MAKVQQGIDYAKSVVNGDIVAGRLTILACQRFLDDLEHGEKRGVYFNHNRAQHILDFYKFIPHVKGDLAGKIVVLMDWHIFILINLFGFVVPLVDELTGKPKLDDNGKPRFVRRFRTAYNEVARKNAKSFIASGIGLYMVGADGEGGAEVYSAATTRDQARIVFADSQSMIRQSKKALGRLLDFNKMAIFQLKTGSKFEPLSSDANSLDGLNIHCGIVDELHAHKTRDVWDVLETATGARLQSLIAAITTAGTNQTGICYEIREYATKVLSGLIEDDSFFAIIYTLDDDDEPFDEKNWIKANPGLGICKRYDDMRRLAKKALEQVSARNNFLTKHLNIWVSSSEAWMDSTKWAKCEPLDNPDKLKEYPLWVGMDLANKVDMCAAVKLWLAHNGDIHADFRFWLPEGRLSACSERMAELYRKWSDMGFLELTDGEVVDHLLIKEEIGTWVQGENLREIAYDPWSATQFARALNEDGFPLVEVPQTVKNLSEAMKMAEAYTYSGRLHHNNNPIMNWMMSNVLVKPDKNDNIFPNKSSNESKIDGPVAMFTGLSRLIVNGGELDTKLSDHIEKVGLRTL
ncbi:terminase large subunit [Orbus wheelerorum]|uniref:terminase large subunit n=1 Tax=Orbus wheelerorum TaxID=3074111 RepID=UPI00370D0F78